MQCFNITTPDLNAKHCIMFICSIILCLIYVCLLCVVKEVLGEEESHLSVWAFTGLSLQVARPVIFILRTDQAFYAREYIV